MLCNRQKVQKYLGYTENVVQQTKSLERPGLNRKCCAIDKKFRKRWAYQKMLSNRQKVQKEVGYTENVVQQTKSLETGL